MIELTSKCCQEETPNNSNEVTFQIIYKEVFKYYNQMKCGRYPQALVSKRINDKANNKGFSTETNSASLNNMIKREVVQDG